MAIVPLPLAVAERPMAMDSLPDAMESAPTAIASSPVALAGVPIVFFNRTPDGHGSSAVTSDNFAGGARVAEFLVAGGHERIAYLAGWDGASTQRDREAGFRAGLAAAGRELFARAVGNFNIDEAQAATRALFDRPDRPDAVFVANDHMAFGAIDVMRADAVAMPVAEFGRAYCNLWSDQIDGGWRAIDADAWKRARA